MHSKSRARPAKVAALALCLTACTLDRSTVNVSTSYDLGPPPSYSDSKAPIAGTLLIPSVRSPAWLDETDIVYRLLYEDRTRPQSYAMSRWAAEPAALVTDRIRSRFAAAWSGVVTPGYSVSSDYTLRVELDDFSQRFDALGQSRGTLLARATLLSTRDRKLVAQREFNIERPSAPNAAGAVKALTEATEAFLDDLVTWTAQNTPLGAGKQRESDKP